MSEIALPAELYIDDEILAVNKPAGISVIHDSHRPDQENLTRLLECHYGRLWVLHRLDRETSGVILYARNAAAHRVLSHQFQMRMVGKSYHLLACGDFSWQSIEVDAPLRLNADRRHRTIADPKTGKPAKTQFTVLQVFAHNLYLLSAKPLTGYTHQIRAHLASINGCILNDALYRPHPFAPEDAPPFDPAPCEAWWRESLPIRRLSLHASDIHFTHPVERVEKTIIAPYPEDFARSLEILNKTGQA